VQSVATRQQQAVLQTPQSVNGSKPKQQISLLTPDGNITNSPITCSQILNSHFHNQFNKTHILNSQSPSTHNPSCGEIDAHGVIRLLHNLKPGKAPGPDGLKKEDLTLDIEQTAGCLSHIFNKSPKHDKLPSE